MDRREGYFVDTVTDELYGEGCDPHGVDLAGADDEGFWWGTERAAWFLSSQHYVVEVSGHLGALPWQGFFIGTVEEAIDYAERRAVKVDRWASGEVL